MVRATKPRVTVACVASRYAAPFERIIEFSDGDDGAGGLILIKRGRDGRLKLHPYRLENCDVLTPTAA